MPATRRNLSLVLAMILATVSLLLGGESLWIWAKGRLAQHLLATAWADTSSPIERLRPWPWADTYPVARLRVPRLGVDQIVLAGASGRTLAFGPGHLDDSSAPGSDGTCIVSGHRDTHFAFLEQIEHGDVVEIETASRKLVRYTVDATEIIDLANEHGAITVSGSGPRLVLLTCYPFHALRPGGTLRYMVHALPAASSGAVSSPDDKLSS